METPFCSHKPPFYRPLVCRVSPSYSNSPTLSCQPIPQERRGALLCIYTLVERLVHTL